MRSACNPVRHFARSGILVLLLLVTFVLPASADVGLPIDVRLVGGNVNIVPEPGQMVAATLELTSEIEIGVQNVQFVSGRDPLGALHWQALLVDAPAEFTLMPGVQRSFAVELLANDPTQPVDIVFQAGSRTVAERWYMVEPSQTAAQALPAGLSVMGEPVLDESPSNGADPAIDLWTQPEPYEPPAGSKLPDREGSLEADADKGAAAKSFLLRVKGRFVYERGDGETIGADGVTVQVWDSDVDADDFLGAGVTLANGTFDFQVLRGDEAGPEVYLVFFAGNAMINVQYSFALTNVQSLSSTWQSQSTIYGDVTAEMIDVGTQSPSQGFLSQDPAFHILSTLTKAWRYVGGLGFNANLDRVRVSWPAATNSAFYRPSNETIFMSDDRQWEEDTIIHEFGHHWVHHYGSSVSPEYCNPGGFQDPPGEDCGHNQWCNENDDVAWSEGLPNFLADLTTTWIEDHYHSIVNDLDLELLAMCGESGQFGNPYLTESILGGLMRDLADFSNENDSAFSFDGADKIGHGVAAVLSVAASALAPTNSSTFLFAYQALNPGLGNAFWSTAMNNGFDVDASAPGMPLNLTSTSHTTVGDSPDGTVDLVWDVPTDDSSGVRRYRIEAANTPSYPEGAGSFYSTYPSATTSELAPGTWWISVLTEDWSGKQSVNYAVFGPVTIRTPEPPDFALQSGRSWPYAVVPRRSADATSSFAPLPNFLAGDQFETWFNYRVVNVGELPNPVNVINRLTVDGAFIGGHTMSASAPLGAGASRVWVNLGPFNIRGGRHMVVARTDATEVMPEHDELDNRESRQFVWAPTILVNDPVDRPAPPDPFGGFVIPNPFASVNCDGLAYLGLDTIAPFTGIAVVPDSPDEDPDLRSFPHTTGPLDGFAASDLLSDSARPAGGADAMITNTAIAPTLLVDVGVRAFDGMTGGYRAFPLSSTSIPTGTETVVALESGQYVSLHHFTISTNFGTEYGTIRVEIDPADGPLWVALIEPDVQHFGLDDATVFGKTMRSGVVTLDFSYDTPLHGLVLYRDRPFDGSDATQLEATVWVGPTPANFTPAVGLAGWAAPIVPTHGATGTSTNVPAPATLIGGTSSTYVNTAIANDGPNPGVPLEHVTRIDGGSGPGAQTSGIVAGGTQRINFPNPITVRGGRHTLWMMLDPNDLVGESDEEDNLWGRQWVWEPPLLSSGPAADFPAPGDPIGGLDAVLLAQTGVFHLNSVGLRDAPPSPSGNDGHWRAVALMPGPASDVDARLHQVVPGTTSGFSLVETHSNWGVGQSDYVLTNFRVVSARPMDIGVIGVSGGESFMAQPIESRFLDTRPQGVYGDFELGNRELLALHEVELQAGPLAIDLIPIEGDVDFGLTLHRANLPYHAKSLTTTSPSVWQAPGGVHETLVADVPQDGFYCLAVWKAGHSDALEVGRYRLNFQATSPTDAPGDVAVVRTGLREVRPNPFNPQTTIAFDLERDGRIDLRVFDVRGALVRTLTAESRMRGPHTIEWDGTDDRGHTVASGVYLVDLRAAGVHDVRKAVLVK